MGTVLMIVLMVMAVILFLGMIADSNAENRKNFTYAFITLVLALVIMFCKI